MRYFLAIFAVCVLAVIGVVDRLQGARERFEAMGLLFRPICTIRDLELLA